MLLGSGLGLGLGLTGCGTGEGPPRSGPGGSDAGSARQRPALIEDTLWLEGAPEPFHFTLFRSPLDWPLPFSTYLPADIAVDSRPPDGTDPSVKIRFVAAFDGQREEQAFLAFEFPLTDLDRAGAIERVRVRAVERARGDTTALRSRRPDSPSRFDWSLEEQDFAYTAEDRWMVGIVALGRHGDRFFLVTLHQPEEWAEGFEPRAARVLRDWRWEDTGEGLGP